MALKKYHITKTEGEWKAKAEGATKSAIVTDTLKQMQKEIKTLKPEGGLSAIYHSSKGQSKGQIREERTYPKGKDPKESIG
jgi:hypothetical protein